MFLEFYLFIDKLNEKLQMNLIVLNIMYNKSNIQRNFVNSLVCRIRHFFNSKFYNVGDKSRSELLQNFPNQKFRLYSITIMQINQIGISRLSREIHNINLENISLTCFIYNMNKIFFWFGWFEQNNSLAFILGCREVFRSLILFTKYIFVNVVFDIQNILFRIDRLIVKHIVKKKKKHIDSFLFLLRTVISFFICLLHKI